ncbi:MAG: tetratricopeptide repeat-containing sensor histidine kinase [Chitinophagales bacterium]
MTRDKLKFNLNKLNSDSEKIEYALDLLKSTQELKIDEKEFLFREISKLKHDKLDYRLELYILQLDFYLKSYKIDERIKLCNEIENIIPKDNHFFVYQLQKNNHLVIAYIEIGELQKAKSLINISIKKALELNTGKINHVLSESYRFLFKIEMRTGNTQLALEALDKALKLKHSLNDYESLYLVYKDYGLIYEDNKDFKKAAEYYQKAIDCNKKYNQKRSLILSILNLSYALDKYGQRQKANELFQESIKLAYQQNDIALISRLEPLLCLSYAKAGNIEKFEKLEKKILKNANLEYTKAGLIFFYFYACEAHYILGNFKKAFRYSKIVEKDWKRIDNKRSLIKLYDLQIKILKEKKNYKKCTVYYEKLMLTNQLILNEQNQKSLKEFEVKYENEKKAKEIQSLKLESTSFQLQSLRAQMNPHFVFNSIASISSSIKPETIENSKTLLNSFARLMRSNLEFAELEKISLEDEIQFLKDYLTLEKNRLGEKLSFEINYSDTLDIDFIEVPSMIIQPYIENAIKHGIVNSKNNGLIKIVFEEKDDFLICTIEDNGIGRKAAEKTSKNSKKHLGKSTTINAKRLNLLASKQKDVIKVNYIDLFNEDNTASGTKVILLIKM